MCVRVCVHVCCLWIHTVVHFTYMYECVSEFVSEYVSESYNMPTSTILCRNWKIRATLAFLMVVATTGRGMSQGDSLHGWSLHCYCQAISKHVICTCTCLHRFHVGEGKLRPTGGLKAFSFQYGGGAGVLECTCTYMYQVLISSKRL